MYSGTLAPCALASEICAVYEAHAFDVCVRVCVCLRLVLRVSLTCSFRAISHTRSCESTSRIHQRATKTRPTLSSLPACLAISARVVCTKVCFSSARRICAADRSHQLSFPCSYVDGGVHVGSGMSKRVSVQFPDVAHLVRRFQLPGPEILNLSNKMAEGGLNASTVRCVCSCAIRAHAR